MVLLVSVGATVVGATVSLSAARSYSERLERDVAAARADADATLVRVRQTLDSDPHLPMRQVLPFERTRVCLPTGSTVPPGGGWDVAACGAVWGYDYTPGEPLGADQDGSARAELVYDLDEATWSVRVLGRGGSLRAGYATRVVRPSAAETTAVSNSDLSFAHLFRNSASTPSGDLSVYATGTVTLPSHTGGGASSPASNAPPLEPTDVVMADTPPSVLPFQGDPASSAGALYGRSGPSSPWSDIRQVAPSPWSLGAAQADLPRVRDIACPDGPPPANIPERHQTTYACVDPGRTLVDVSGDEHVVPLAATAVAVLPTSVAVDGFDRPALRLLWTTRQPAGLRCTSPCDLTVAGRASVAERTHPGDRNHWTGTADIWWPSTGVVASTRDVHVGMCGADGFLQAADPEQPTRRARCQVFGPTDSTRPGATFQRPLTVLAGTPAQPASVYVGSPITTVRDNVNVGLVATGEVKIGWWARPPGGSLDIHAAAIAFGLTRNATAVESGPSAIHATPAHVCTATDDNARCSNNTGETLRWTGALAAPQLRLVSNQFNRVTLVAHPPLTDHPPPLFPALDDAAWRTISKQPLSWTSDTLTTADGEPACTTPACPSW